MIRSFSAIATRGSLSGILTLAALALPPTCAAADPGITEFSSQHIPGTSAGRRDSGPGPRGPGVGPRGGVNPGGGGAPRTFRGPPGAGPRGPVGVVGPRVVGPRGPVGVVGPGIVGPRPDFRGPPVGFRGPVGVTGFRGGRAAFIRGRHHVRRGGLLLPLVGLGALGAIYVGSRYYTPYAYVDGPVGEECVGPTEDGVCELRMTEVPLEGGGAELQCVAYCPPQ
jgi:hypothetical protein